MKESRQFNLHDAKSGAALACRVTSGSQKDAIQEVLDDGTIKVNLNAPSDESLENQALLAFFARILNTSPGNIEVVASQGRKKLVTVMNMTTDQVHDRITKNIASG